MTARDPQFWIELFWRLSAAGILMAIAGAVFGWTDKLEDEDAANS